MPNSRTKAKQNQAEALLERIINTDEKAALVWTTLGLRELAGAAAKQGCQASPGTVRKALRSLGYTLGMTASGPGARQAGTNHLTVDGQCSHINRLLNYCRIGKVPALYLDFSNYKLRCRGRKWFTLAGQQVSIATYLNHGEYRFEELKENLTEDSYPDKTRFVESYHDNLVFDDKVLFFLLEGKKSVGIRQFAARAADSVKKSLKYYPEGPLLVIYSGERPLHNFGEFREKMEALAVAHSPLYVSWLPPCSFKWGLYSLITKFGFFYMTAAPRNILSLDIVVSASLLTRRSLRLLDLQVQPLQEIPEPPEAFFDDWNIVFKNHNKQSL